MSIAEQLAWLVLFVAVLVLLAHVGPAPAEPAPAADRVVYCESCRCRVAADIFERSMHAKEDR